MTKNVMLSIITMNAECRRIFYCYAECYDECHYANAIMLNDIILCVIMLNVVILNGIMLNDTMLNGIILNDIMLNGIMLNGIMLNGIMLNGIMLSGIMLNGIILNGIMLNGISATESGDCHTGSVIFNRSESRGCMGRVFNFRLGSFTR